MKHKHWLIIYDISNPRRLQRVAKVISQYGLRVQKSVFEADTNDGIIDILQKKLERIIKETDFIAIIPLCEQDWQKAEKYGAMVQSNYINGKYEIL